MISFIPRLKILKNYKLNIILFGLIWALLVVLPHFQPDRSIPFLLISTLLFLVLITSIQVIFSKFVPYAKTHLLFLSIAFFVEITLILLAIMNLEEPYLLFSRLGSYSMFQNDNLMLFGDLRHLTSTVNCSININIGADICDPWKRGFNQNPDVAKIFRVLGLSSATVVGISTTILFFLIILLIIHNYKPHQQTIYLFFFTPPVILAIDRGNEIITVSLILLVVLFEKWKIHPNVSLALLSIASIFKFWPFVILIFKTLVTSSLNPLKKMMIILVSSLYIGVHLSDIQNIARETQRGNLNGGSFGLGLIEYKSVYDIITLGIIVTGTLLVIINLKAEENALMKQLNSSPLLKALFFAYCVVYVSGIHFNYRLVVLLPVAFLLLEVSNAIKLLNFLFAVLLTSRLNIAPATTSILALYFSYILVKSSTENVRAKRYLPYSRLVNRYL